MTNTHARFFLTTIACAVVLLLAQCLWLYGHTGRDDAFLTYWPAVTLAEHGQILNYNGERVEQSSTVLHTLALAALHRLLPTVGVPTLAWALSLIAGALTLLFTALILRERQQGSTGILALAAAPSLVFWSSSGMETLAATALLTAVLLLCLREQVSRSHSVLLVITTSLAVLCRPEIAFVLLAFTAAGWLLIRQQPKTWLLVLLATMISFALVSGWRHSVFGDWFPQPVDAKRSVHNAAAILKGISYILLAGDSLTTRIITLAGIAATIVALCWPRHPQRRPILMAGSLAMAQIAFILATGGDWMDATRFLLPVLPALLLCGLLLVSPWRAVSHTAIGLLLVIALFDSWQFARLHSSGLSVTDRATASARYLTGAADLSTYSVAELQTKDALRDIPQLEHLRKLVQQLQPQSQPKPLQVASIQMGFIPFHLARQFYGQLHFLDLRALSTRELTRCDPTREFNRSETGLRLSYDEFFALLPSLQRDCDIRKPDIIYDLGYAMRKEVLARNGYVITYLEQRHIQGDFSQRAVGSELFVAVRRELAAQYGVRDHAGNVVTLPTIQRPNIVLLLADDISYDHFGFMGNPAARTPTLDQLARQGTVFTSGYVPTAFCRPTLATLLTGSWPHQHRIHSNNGVIALPPGYTTLATLLQQQGYATFAGGKFWEDEPQWRGFDGHDTDKNRFARDQQDALWQFIDQHAGQQPLFLWWAPMLPHTPHNPPQVMLDAINSDAIAVPANIPADKQQEYRDKTRNLLAMNRWLDDEIRKLQEKLAETNLLDNTVIVFMADNGFSHRAISKSSPYELGLRTPILFHWPDHVAAQRLDAPTSIINVYNTVLDYAGVNVLPADRPQPGHSLRPVLQQAAPARAEPQFGADYQAVAMKTDPLPRPERDIYALHVRDGDWKYILYLRDLREENNSELTIQRGMKPFPVRNAGDEELYYLPADGYEENNLAVHTEQQQRIEDYRRRVLDWWFSTGGQPFDAMQTCPAEPAALCRKLAAVQR